MFLLTRQARNCVLGIMASTALLLSACGSYQAPVSDQGMQQVISAPIIVDSSTPESSFRIPNSPPITVSSSNSSSNSSASSSSNSISSSARTARSPAATASASANRRAVTPIQSSSAQGRTGPTSHRVRAGDTLFSIAYQHDLDFRSLAIANGLNPPYTIFVDQQIDLDINNLTPSSSSISTANLGTAVSNNSVASSSAGSARTGAVLRQPVETATRAVSWQWPHQGRLLRGFQAGVNKGLDIAGAVGDPVTAAGDGDVVYSGSGIQGSGDLIIIRHSDRYLSAYAHNSTMLVKEGSRVRAGEKIAEVGKNSAGVAMLHFEIREAGDSIDPSRLLPSR